MKHVHYQSIGNTVGLEEDSDDYWEITENGDFERSIHILPDGAVLKYDRNHDADKFSQLPEGPITDENLADSTFGRITIITLEEFEKQWVKQAINRG